MAPVNRRRFFKAAVGIIGAAALAPVAKRLADGNDRVWVDRETGLSIRFVRCWDPSQDLRVDDFLTVRGRFVNPATRRLDRVATDRTFVVQT